MELTVRDRILLLSLLPKEGDITTIRLVHQLRTDLSFSEDEHQRLRFQHNENGVSWADETLVKDISIGPRAHILVSEALAKLNTDKKLTPEFLSLYDRFVETKD